MKILNLYAGIGGNRKLWPEGHEITAVEWKPEIATIYAKLYPNDRLIIGDAHQYLLEHFQEFDFIWSSPPCPTHSTFERLHFNQGYEIHYPDMKLYEEILLLQFFFKGKFCVENVVSYYEPLIKPQAAGRHYYWANFRLPCVNEPAQNIKRLDSEAIAYKEKLLDFNLESFNLTSELRNKVLNNCVNPKIGALIFKAAFTDKQKTIGEIR